MDADQLKERIDLHDLAEKLDWVRPGKSNGNYRSPHRKDKRPSVSIFNNGTRFKDMVTGQAGSCIDMVMYHHQVDAGEAMRILHDLYGLERSKSDVPAPPKTWAEELAGRCRNQAEMIFDYLRSRGIDEQVITRGIKAGALGFNTWTNEKKQPGEFGYGGNAAAFICRSLNPGRVTAVELRYLDPALNGDVKTQTQGEKKGTGWTSDIRWLRKAPTVLVCESPINALSVETAGAKGMAAYATRGLGIEDHDWSFLYAGRDRPAEVLIAMDNDAPLDDGRRPGPEAAWNLYDLLTAHGVAAHLVNQVAWDVNDINDFLVEQGPDELRKALRDRFQWIIPGNYGERDISDERRAQLGPPRVFLPAHDWSKYALFRTKQDFTTYIKGWDNTGDSELPQIADLCGFRVAAIQRVLIASAKATLSGDPDDSPRSMFAVSCQSGFHGNRLQREVLDHKQIHNIDRWKAFGPVFSPQMFLRMVQILGRTAHHYERRAANFVGLCWKQGRLAFNEGPDTYFADPQQQCPYHSLVFPSGPTHDAATVIRAYQTTFRENAAAMPLVWGLGAHLKVVLGFWPHFIMEADKGAGKSTLIKRLESTIGMTMFSGESMQTKFRILTSLSGTCHPVGWEEISARRKDVIDAAVSNLQEAYQYSVTRRGSDMLEFVVCAPVLLAGEDAPVKSLLGKIVSTDLSERKGPMLPQGLPPFPVRQWLEYLSQQQPAAIRGLFDAMKDKAMDMSMAAPGDPGAERMSTNYAAMLTAWRLLCDFAGLDQSEGDFERSLLTRMNVQIRDTSADREPFVWILEKVFLEIEAGRYRFPVDWTSIDQPDGSAIAAICLRPSHAMHQIEHSNELKDFFNSLPIKSHTVLKRQMTRAGLILTDTASCYRNGRRISHLSALSIPRLEELGLQPPEPPTNNNLPTDAPGQHWLDD